MDLDCGAGKTYTIVWTKGYTNETIPWNLTYTVLSNSAEMSSYSLPGQTGVATINSAAGTIDVTMPFGATITNLAATFTPSTGALTKVGTTTQASGATANNFTTPVVYVVTAQNGTTNKTWTVTVNIAPNTAAEIATYSLPGQTGVATINSAAGTIDVTMPFGATITSLAATFGLSAGAALKVGTTTQASGTTKNNFTTPVVYVVTAQNGTTNKTWTVTVNIAPNTAAEIATYSLPGQTGIATINSAAGTIDVTMPYGATITSLAATFGLSAGAALKVGTTTQASGTTKNNFTTPVVYVVTAQNGTTNKTWTVTVNIAPNTAAEIATYSLPGQTGIATINSAAGTIDVTMPYGATITSLAATFGLSAGAVLKVGTTTQASGTTKNNFTTPVVYVVTAQKWDNIYHWSCEIILCGSACLVCLLLLELLLRIVQK